MPTNLKWVFYDSLAKTQSNPITTDEAQMALFKMRPRDIERFYIWTVGWNEWQSLALYLTTEQKFFITAFTIQNDDTVKARVRDVLEMTPALSQKSMKEMTNSFSSIRLDEDTLTNPDQPHSNFDGEDISWENIDKPEIDFSKLKKKSVDRREQRHELKIEVILISSKGKTFRSKSKNISLSGSLLEDNIPFDYYGVVFDVVIVNKESKNPTSSRLCLKGKTVGDGLTQRVQYENLTEEKKVALQNLLKDYIDQQKSFSKKSA